MFKLVSTNKDIPEDFWSKERNHDGCMHDTEPFFGIPYSIPLTREDEKWTVYGQFCSLNCTKMYMVCSKNNYNFSLFNIMCKSIYGIDENIKCAPESTVLKKFNFDGGISIEEFRQEKLKCKKIVSIFNISSQEYKFFKEEPKENDEDLQIIKCESQTFTKMNLKKNIKRKVQAKPVKKQKRQKCDEFPSHRLKKLSEFF